MNTSVSEHDLELLETYLDNELLPDAMDSIRTRLKREPALAMALDQLTRDRQLRHQVFFTMDREVAATALASTESIGRSLKQAAVREVAWGNRRSIFRQLSTAAACILVGLLVGWFGRERTEPRTARPSNESIATISNDKPAGGFNVAITDDYGNVLAEQHFNTLNEARQFSNDLLRLQTRQRDMRNSDVRLVRDRF